MTIEAQARIVLRGGSEALKQLQGVTRGTQAASKAQQQAAKSDGAAQKQMVRDHQARMRAADAASKTSSRASAQEQRDAQKSAAARAKAAQDAQRAEERAAAVVQKLQEQQAQRWQQMAQKSASVRMKADAQVTAAAQREAAKQEQIAQRTAAAQVDAARKRNRDLGGLVGAIGGGLLAGGLSAVSTARGATGARSVTERVQQGNEFRQRLFVATQSAGLSPEDREKVQGQVLSASTKTGSDAGDLLGVVEEGQAKFNSLKFFSDNLEEIATAAKASGADTKDLAVALGYMRQAFGLTDKEALESAYLLKSAADKGSIEVKDFAKDFAAGAGIFATNTGQRGLGGVRQLLGTAQAIGTGGFGSAESATRFERFSADLNDKEVRKGLAGIGVKGFTDASGKVNVGKLVQQLSTNRKFQKADVRQGIFKETRSLQAVEALMSANQRVRSGAAGAIDFNSIANGADAEAGRASVSGAFQGMQDEGWFKAQQENARMQSETTLHLEEFNGQLGFVTKAANELEAAFGSLSIWASSIGAAGLGAVGGSLVKGIFGGGAAAAGAGAAGVGAAGAAVGAGGKALGVLGRVGGVAGKVLGPVGAVLTLMDLEKRRGEFTKTGGGMDPTDSPLKAFQALMPEWLGGTPAQEARASASAGGAGSTAGGGGSARDLIDATKAQTRVLERIDSGLRANQPTAPSAPREPR